MKPLLVYPEPPPAPLVAGLDAGGFDWEASGDLEHAPVGEDWSGAVVCAHDGLGGALALCRALRQRVLPLAPVLVVVEASQLQELRLGEDLFDDFVISPFRPGELDARLIHLFVRTGGGSRPELIEFGPLVLNLETYQAHIDGRPLDLTYMEYELLKFLAANPAKAFTRVMLLSQVWGYEYYGGSRTVDVHIRRLRNKLGEHASLIATVRSVGYRFGKSRWEL